LVVKTTLKITVNLVTVLCLVVSLMAWGIYDMCLGYSTPEEAPRCQSISFQIPVSLMVIIFLWSLRLQLIRPRWLQNILIGLLLLYGGIIVIYILREIIRDSDDVIVYFPIFLYGSLIVLSAFMCMGLRQDKVDR